MSRFPVVCLTARLALLIVSMLADSGYAAPALPGDPCQVEPRPVWSETETWVWSQICVGKVADLNVRFGRDLDHRSREGWTEERKLSVAFLETILLHEPWRSAIPRQGVHVIAAWIEEEVALQDAEISRPLRVEKSRFASGVDLRRVRIASAVALAGSFVKGVLRLNTRGSRVSST